MKHRLFKARSLLAPGVLMVALAAVSSCASVNPLTNRGTQDLAEDERRLWNRGIEEAQRLDASGRLYEDAELVRYVNAIAAKLLPEELRGAGIKWGVRVIRNPYLNAFALPHGAIYVHTGILAQMDNEAQLAALLGHEMVHVTHRHPLQSFRTAQNTTNTLAVLGALSMPAGHFGAIVQLLGLVGGMASVSGYSRSMEREADARGFAMMVAAGYDPTEAPRLFDQLKRDREDRQVAEPFFFGSHPRLGERKESFEDLIAQNPTSRNGFRGSDVFMEKIAAVLVENAMMDISLGRWEWAEEALQKFVTARPRDPEGLFHLAEVYRRRNEKNDQSRAEFYYDAAIKLDERFAPAYQSLGLLLIKRGDKIKAARSFEKYLELAPMAKDRGYVENYLSELRGNP